MENAKKIADEVAAGKANINMAVMQFMNNPKVMEFVRQKDLQQFLESIDDEDPFEVREMPAIQGVKQYLLLDKNTKLPFGEEGLTAQQAQDQITTNLVLEQLQIYGDKFPWTRPMIEEGMQRANKSSCKSCEHKRLVQEVAIAVKEKIDSFTPVAGQTLPDGTRVERRTGDNELVDEYKKNNPRDDEQWGAREPCPMCTLKHLGQAIVLFNESLTGYPTHRWIAVGHMAEAEAEAPSQDMANRIRAQRIIAMDEPDFIPHLTDLLAELDAIVRG